MDVKVAITLFGAALLAGALDLTFQHMGVSTVESEVLSSLAGVVFGVATTVVLLVLVMKRHNWARVVLAILTALGVLVAVPIVSKELGIDPVGAVMSLVQCVLQIAGLVFLFRGPANAWFRSR